MCEVVATVAETNSNARLVMAAGVSDWMAMPTLSAAVRTFGESLVVDSTGAAETVYGPVLSLGLVAAGLAYSATMMVVGLPFNSPVVTAKPTSEYEVLSIFSRCFSDAIQPATVPLAVEKSRARFSPASE